MTRAASVGIGNAVIWAAVILASAMVLRGTDGFAKLLPILGGGAGGSIVVVAGGLRRPQADRGK